MKKYLLSLMLLPLSSAALASDDVGYNAFLQYRNTGHKIGTSPYSNEIMPDTSGGQKFFPSLQSRELTYFKNVARTTKDVIAYGDWNKKYRVIFGYEQGYGKSKTSKSSYGYSDDSGTLFVMADTLVAKNFRLGGGLSFDVFDTDYHVGDMYQNQSNIMTSLYSIYNNPESQIRVRNILYLGFGKTNLKRQSDALSYKSDFYSGYYGMQNAVSKTFNIKYGLYLQPSAELNFYGVSREKFSENNGFALDHNDGHQIEGLVGIYAGWKNDKISLKSGPELTSVLTDIRKAYYIEYGGGDVLLKKRTEDKNYVVWKNYVTYNINDNVSLYGDFRYYERSDDNILWTIGINYKF